MCKHELNLVSLVALESIPVLEFEGLNIELVSQPAQGIPDYYSLVVA